MVKEKHTHQKYKSVFLFIEGGGDDASLKAQLRDGFSKFFGKTDFKTRRPKIVAGGGRNNTYDLFCSKVPQGDLCILLVDSEELVAENCSSAWEHFKNREGDKHWMKPANAGDDDAHMMVCCMESWFLADREKLRRYFGQGFKDAKLPNTAKGIENVSKNDVLGDLKRATKECKTKFIYDKGSHSFDLIGQIDPERVDQAGPWTKKLFDKLRETCQVSRKS
ncbi:MAG TPA: hypothetical protein DEB39_13955 [Planctomycetaceae bacterium]|nr:hypothetical protein [Planctomycetaceae bacterium]